MRLGVYTDAPYHIRDGEPYGEQAFAVFVAHLAPRFSRLALFGRLDPSTSSRARYRLGSEVDFVSLPYYRALGDLGGALRAVGATMGRFWRGLADLDCVWLLGPNPFVVIFALLAILRRRRIVLGVRQDYPAYVRARHPNRRGIQAMAMVIDLAFRVLARRHPVIAVGPDLAAAYSHSPALLEIAVSLVEPEELVSPEEASQRPWEGERQVLLEHVRLERARVPAA